MPDDVARKLPTVVDQTAGRFGVVTVSDADGARSLWCETLCHGSSYLAPSAVIDGDTYTPGPIPEASYHMGWMIAVSARPDGYVLMAGLGAGSGVTALLHEFPQLHMTVAEIDHEVTRLARQHFPLLQRYEREGRLTIVTSDVMQLVGTGNHHRKSYWSLALLDTYQYSSILVCPKSLLLALHDQVEALWLNIVDDEPGFPLVQRFSTLLTNTGWTPRTIMPILGRDRGTVHPTGNVLLGTVELDHARARAVDPFANMHHPHATQARLSYHATREHLCDDQASLLSWPLLDAHHAGGMGRSGTADADMRPSEPIPIVSQSELSASCLECTPSPDANGKISS